MYYNIKKSWFPVSTGVNQDLNRIPLSRFGSMESFHSILDFVVVCYQRFHICFPGFNHFDGSWIAENILISNKHSEIA
jgi:hypothetical protein